MMPEMIMLNPGEEPPTRSASIGMIPTMNRRLKFRDTDFIRNNCSYSKGVHRIAMEISARGTGTLATGFPALIASLALLGLAGCEKPPADTLQGYVEGEFVRMASPFTGTLEKLNVRRGDRVAAGAALYALESASEKAGTEEARNRLASAQARLDNLLSGRRRPELDVVRAQLAQAIAARDLSQVELRRQQKLFNEGFVSKDHLDTARTAYTRDSARVDELRAQDRSARQSLGREDEIRAAEGEVDASRAVLAQREWDLEQKSVSALTPALVHDTYYAQGEWVPAGSPVVSLLPPGNIKVRFYLPEPLLGAVTIGQEIHITCDGCPAPVAGRLTYVARQAEYTPPVIYSERSRARLVFLAEAQPQGDGAANLHVGQPVDVRLAAAR